MRSLSTGYDPLNRVTGAPYGYLYRSPSQGILAVPSNEYAAPSFGYDAAGNITAIKRMGIVAGVDCFEPKTIDNLNLIYDPASSRLNKMIDSAPADGRPYGFKPGADDDAKYYHDANGNMTQSMFEGQSLSCKGQFFGDTALLFLTVPPVRSSKRRLPDTSCTGQVVSPENWLFSLSNPASKHALRPAQGLVDALQFP